MIGYHYTSYGNYLTIREKGLVPYEIYTPELFDIFKKVLLGIWLFKERQQNEKLLGSLFWQIGTKQTTKVVELQCEYSSRNLLIGPKGQHLTITHDGGCGGLIYHKKEPCVIVTKSIRVNKIKLLTVYDFIEMFNEAKNAQRI